MIEDILVLVIPQLLLCDINNNNGNSNACSDNSSEQISEVDQVPRTETSSANHGIADTNKDEADV